jgi:signal transduction histidine kinase
VYRIRVAGHRITPFAAVPAVAFGLLYGTAVFPGGGTQWPALAAGVALQLLATAALVRLTHRPDLAMAATVVVAALLTGFLRPWPALVAVQAVPWVPVAVAWATVRVFEDARSLPQLRVAGTLVAGYLAVVAATAPGGVGPAVFGAAVPLLGGTCVSMAVRLRRARADRAVSLAAERAATAYRARVDERQRVAARLHDNLGHVLTLVVLRANALGASAADPRVRAAAEQIGALGTAGLTELRHPLDLVGAPAAAPPAHSTPGWHEPTAELVEQARAAGQQVSLSVAEPAPVVGTAAAAALVPSS